MTSLHRLAPESQSLPLFHVNETTTSLFGVDLHKASMQQAIVNIDSCIQARQSLHIGMLNAAKLVNMRRNPELGADVKQSNMILADGASIVMASKWLGKALPERVAGIDLIHAIFKQGDSQGYRVFCLGATQEVLDKVASEVAILYPGVVIAGRQHGYFKEEEEESVARQIADSKADVLFVAITSPKKERFMARWNNLMQVPVVHGVGGSFDVLAGKVDRAPLFWQKYGLEWLYRVKQEPRRLWKRYLITNTLFIGLLLKEVVYSKK